jgi:endonuclease/exonuclease/phosphatase family metal-dependent hydrolase
MRVATWNLMRPRQGTRRWGELLEHVGRIEADVWVLTETGKDFSPGPQFRLVAESAVAPDRTARESWVAIWARGTGSAVPTADPQRTACACIGTAAGGSVVVYGTVLPWLSDSRWPERGFRAFERALTQQFTDWRQLQRDYFGVPLVVAGDFNQDLAPFHYYGSGRGKRLLGQTLADAELHVATGGPLDPLLGYPRRASIDHICATRQFRAVRNPVVWPAPERVGKALTDHFGVLVDYVPPT